MTTDIGIWLEAICTIMIMSLLYTDNVFFRIGECLLVGLGAGYTIAAGYGNIVDLAWKPGIAGNYWLFIPFFLGMLLYTRFFKRIAWLSRFALAFSIGVGAALSLTGTLSASFISQIKATVLPLNSLDNIIMVVGVVTTLSYFLYSASAQQHGILRAGNKIGRIVMMIAFGSSFGNTVMARMSFLIGIMERMFGDWIYLIKT